MQALTSPFTIQATVMHTPTFGGDEVLPDALVSVDLNGVITSVCEKHDPQWQQIRTEAKQSSELLELGDGCYLLPGLVDTHIHAPQWPQLGKALHLPLEEWLLANTFPLEARYGDTAFAHRIYSHLVHSLLANGTTTAVYYGTIHNEANQALADICLTQGQRAFVGRVAMDHTEQCPAYYRDANAIDAVTQTQAFIQYTQALSGNEHGLVKPVITPRFIPSCTDELLQGLGTLAADTDCLVQTHCSESDWEHQFVIDRCGKTDTEALDDFGLLRAHTVLAHSNFITDNDMTRIRHRGAGVAHCPLSNHYFSNSVFPLRHVVERGLQVGLGTDISGGPSASMFDSCRSAVAASRSLQDGVDPSLDKNERGREASAVDFRHAFWLATAGGGELLGEKIGVLAPGYAFDALVIDTNSPNSNVTVFEESDDLNDTFQKIVYGAQRENITSVWVNGRQCQAGGHQQGVKSFLSQSIGKVI